MYESYEYVKKLLQSYIKVNMLIVELKSDALKERHWKQLTKQLRVSWVISELTLGQVWDVNLLKNEMIVSHYCFSINKRMTFNNNIIHILF